MGKVCRSLSAVMLALCLSAGLAAGAPFNVGEKLVFSISWTNVVEAGIATMEVVDTVNFNGHNCYHIVSTTESAPAFSSFFYVKDRVDTYFDMNTYNSLKFEKHLREGDYKNDVVVYYDPENQLVAREEKLIRTLENAMDVMTAFYWVRSLDLQEGKVFYFNHSDGKTTKTIEVDVLETKSVTVPAGTFNCICVEPDLSETEGIFKQSGRIWIWLTNDAKHMPVLMQSSIVIGDITARLASYTEG
jgi:hypothetical protein